MPQHNLFPNLSGAGSRSPDHSANSASAYSHGKKSSGINPYQVCIIPSTVDYERLRESGSSPEWIIRKRKADDDKASVEEDRLQPEAWDRGLLTDIPGTHSGGGNITFENDRWDCLTTQINEWTKEGKTSRQILDSRRDMRLREEKEREEILQAFAEEDRLQQKTWDRRIPTANVRRWRYHTNSGFKAQMRDDFTEQVEEWKEQGKNPWQILELRRARRLREENEREERAKIAEEEYTARQQAVRPAQW